MPRLLGLFALAAAAAFVADDAATQEEQAAQKESLAKVQRLVGSWRGVGQPQRGSTKNSWTEDADWIWTFGTEGPALVAKSSQGKYFRTLKLTAGQQEGKYTLTATPTAGDGDVRYEGRLDDQGQLIFDAEKAVGDLPRRLSFRFVAGGDRLLVLMERQRTGNDNLVRLAEVGYTRQGSGFGKATAQRECIVTGGLGTIEVSHDGKTYYVCCTGCRDYFNEDPKKILVEYFARKEAEKKKD
jgi:YHS domain-containing protein